MFSNNSKMKSTIFWDITSCSPLNVNRQFRGTYRLHLQPAFTLVSCSAFSFTLKMEVICSSETSIDTQRTTGRYIPEGGTLHNHHCENPPNPTTARWIQTRCWCLKGQSRDLKESLNVIIDERYGLQRDRVDSVGLKARMKSLLLKGSLIIVPGSGWQIRHSEKHSWSSEHKCWSGTEPPTSSGRP
jgi:hypothetical protein